MLDFQTKYSLPGRSGLELVRPKELSKAGNFRELTHPGGVVFGFWVLVLFWIHPLRWLWLGPLVRGGNQCWSSFPGHQRPFIYGPITYAATMSSLSWSWPKQYLMERHRTACAIPHTHVRYPLSCLCSCHLFCLPHPWTSLLENSSFKVKCKDQWQALSVLLCSHTTSYWD